MDENPYQAPAALIVRANSRTRAYRKADPQPSFLERFFQIFLDATMMGVVAALCVSHATAVSHALAELLSYGLFVGVLCFSAVRLWRLF